MSIGFAIDRLMRERLRFFCAFKAHKMVDPCNPQSALFALEEAQLVTTPDAG